MEALPRRHHRLTLRLLNVNVTFKYAPWWRNLTGVVRFKSTYPFIVPAFAPWSPATLSGPNASITIPIYRIPGDLYRGSMKVAGIAESSGSILVSTEYEMVRVIAHEVGHELGLGHALMTTDNVGGVTVRDSVMNPGSSGAVVSMVNFAYLWSYAGLMLGHGVENASVGKWFPSVFGYFMLVGQYQPDSGFWVPVWEFKYLWWVARVYDGKVIVNPYLNLIPAIIHVARAHPEVTYTWYGNRFVPTTKLKYVPWLGVTHGKPHTYSG